jgi:hypothetical protein
MMVGQSIVCALVSVTVSLMKTGGSVVSAQETNVIYESACSGNLACENNDVGFYLNISGASCTGERACSENQLQSFWVSNGACTGPKSSDQAYGTCSRNGDAIDQNLTFTASGKTVCTGASSCSRNRFGISFQGSDMCTGANSCSNNDVVLSSLGNNSCTGVDSCSFLSKNATTNEYSEVILDMNTCTAAGSCSQGFGPAIVQKNSCTGRDSCQTWSVGSDGTASFYVGEGACTGTGSCRNLVVGGDWQYISILEGSCTGANSCVNLTEEKSEISIQPGACTEDNSCQNCNRTAYFSTGAQNCDGISIGGSSTAAARWISCSQLVFLSILTVTSLAWMTI